MKATSASILRKALLLSSKSKSTIKLFKGPVLKAPKVRIAFISPQKKQNKIPKSLIITLQVLALEVKVV